MTVRDFTETRPQPDGEDEAPSTGAEADEAWSRLSHSAPLVTRLIETTEAAGNLALAFFRSGEQTTAAITHKAGGSPVTEADEAVNRYLEVQLRKAIPEAAWLSEESIDSCERLAQDLVLVIDPIDGTRGFVAGMPAWAVAVALVYRSRPIIGIIHAPAVAQTYVAVKNCGARLNGAAIRVSALPALTAGARVAGPQPLAQSLHRAGLEFDLLPKIPSLALRIAYVAAGQLDAALVSENSCDWDIAAADLILHEAGGRLASLDGEAPRYNRQQTRHGVLVAAPTPIVAQIHAAISRA